MSFEKHPTLNTAVLVYPMLPNFGFYIYVLLKACCIIKLAHDDLKMWKCISDVVEEIKVTEQSAWWFGVSLISALNSYKEVVWLAWERRGNNWSCSERWLVRLSWRSSGWTEMNPVWDKNWCGNRRGSWIEPRKAWCTSRQCRWLIGSPLLEGAWNEDHGMLV